jgi:hypothetical protein
LARLACALLTERTRPPRRAEPAWHRGRLYRSGERLEVWLAVRRLVPVAYERSRSRCETRWPGRRANTSSRRHSVGVRRTSWPAATARRSAKSSSKCSAGPARGRRPAHRPGSRGVTRLRRHAGVASRIPASRVSMGDRLTLRSIGDTRLRRASTCTAGGCRPVPPSQAGRVTFVTHQRLEGAAKNPRARRSGDPSARLRAPNRAGIPLRGHEDRRSAGGQAIWATCPVRASRCASHRDGREHQ